MRFYFLVLMLVMSLALGGCLGSGSTESGSDPMSSGLNYYYAEFPDVAIPNEMQPDKSDTFITYSGDGVKLGTQVFKGRVELSSLVGAMQGYMHRDGWGLRSVFRATRGAIMIFEQQQKMCSLYFFEDTFNTGMLVFVSPKLADGVIQQSVPVSTYSEPLPPSDPVVVSDSKTAATATTDTAATAGTARVASANGNITVYPAK